MTNGGADATVWPARPRGFRQPQRGTGIVTHAATDHIATLGLLNGFALLRGGYRVKLSYSGQRLLAFLAICGRPVRRDWVAGTLWLDSSQQQANGCLRTTLWRLDPLSRALVRTSGSELALDDQVTVDAREVVSCAQRVFDDGGDRDELRRLQGVGDLLPDWYDDWVVLERERVRQLRLHALEALCTAMAAKGHYADSTEAGLAAVAGEPLRESAQRVLIASYLREGNACEALRQYRMFRDLLRRELGLAPSLALQRQIAQIIPAHSTL
jgi:DNA-binding SARP family transcriptional activator